MAKLLTKEEILAAPDLKTKTVEVPEWGGTVKVSQVTAADRCELQGMLLDDTGKPKSAAEINRMMTIGLCAMACVDENGNKLFTQADIEAFGKKSSNAIDKIFAAADELNGISASMGDKLAKN